MAPYEAGWHGRQVHLAQLFKPGTAVEMLPSIIEARVAGVRRSLLITGMEQVTTGRKSIERHRQTWLCAHERIPPIEWAARPAPRRAQNYTGFDPADDDIAF